MYRYMKAIKIAAGSTVAVIIANTLGLDYVMSAGIITLLSVQDTKKATVSIALKRVIAFIVAAILSYIIYRLFSYTPISFGVFLLVFTIICIKFKMQDALSMNAVLSTHYLLEQSTSFSLIGNEALLLFIGAGIGICMNLFIPNNEKQIRETQKTIEECLKSVLKYMVEMMKSENCSYKKLECMDYLEGYIVEGIEHAYLNMNNTLLQDSRYFIEYMEMREQQYYVLKEIYEKITTLTMVTDQSLEVSKFIQHISDTLSESHNTRILLVHEKELMQRFKGAPLPLTREEFENRAMLYVILMDFKIFLKTKKAFVDALTDNQKEKYWVDGLEISENEKLYE